jgi:hypothetical protein
VWANGQLIRIRSSFVADRNRLTAPYELCATRAKAPPTAKRQLRWATVGRSVPTFHRLNSEPISHSDITAVQRLSERRRISAEQLRITWDRDVKRLQEIAKCFYVANAAETEERILIHERATARLSVIVNVTKGADRSPHFKDKHSVPNQV